MTVLVGASEMKLIWAHILTLFVPGRQISLPDTYAGLAAGDLSNWPRGSIEILMIEGRRQLDSLNARFEGIRNRGQYVIGMTLGAIAFSAAGASLVAEHLALFVPWCIGLLVLAWTLLCGSAVFAGRAELGSVDALLLSRGGVASEDDVARSVAAAYVTAIRRSTNAVNVRFTLLRDTIWFLILGVLIVAITLGSAITV